MEDDMVPASDCEVADRLGDRELRHVLCELLNRLLPRDRTVV